MKNIILIIICSIFLDIVLFSQKEYPRIIVTDDIEIIKISDHSYVHTTYIQSPQYGRIGSNGFIYTNKGQALLFDTPMTEDLTIDLVRWIRDSLQAEITGFAPNHWHDDCMGGLEYLHSIGIKSYAFDLTREIARSENLPVPNQGFTDSLILRLGELEIICKYPGPAHSMDNIVVWVPSEKILFGGCMVKDLRSPGLGNTADGDLNEYPKTLKKVLKEFQDARIVIPGHGQFGGLELVKHTLDLATNQEESDFQWPEGKEMGLSLTFDDARLTQIDKGIPLLDKYGVKATFYVSPDNMLQRLDGWEKAIINGHDIGNHSIFHPCSGNFKWSRQTALEDYTLARMQTELDSANTFIKGMLGVVPVSFGYPCGQTFIGRGTMTGSYVPLIAAMFETGRGWRNEGPNDPAYCDMAQLTGMELDGKSFDEIKQLIESAKDQGAWLILVGHEMNNGGNQTSLLFTIEEICKYATDPSNGIWIDHVHNIASYIRNRRGAGKSSEVLAYPDPVF